MVIRRRVLISALFASNIVAAGAQDASGQWIALSQEPSRQELFEMEIANDLRSNPLTPDEQESFALLGPFNFPNDVTHDRTVKPPLPRNDVLFGIDISHHQGPAINFMALKAQGVHFVYAKATQGTLFKDPLFAENWASLGDLTGKDRMFRGAYHFLSAHRDQQTKKLSGRAQARSYLAFVSKRGGFKADDLPPVVDIEWDIRTKGGSDQWSKFSPDEIIEGLSEWLEEVRAQTGRIPVIYTARSWWSERVGSDDKLARLAPYKLWIADYSRKSRATEMPRTIGKTSPHLWQFTDKSRVTLGYGKILDANIFYGQSSDFIHEFGLPN